MGSFEKNSREAVSFIMIRVWLLLGLCAVLASGRHYHVQYVPLPHQYYPQQQQYYLQPQAQQYYPQQQQYYLQPQQYYQQPQQYYPQQQQYYPQQQEYYPQPQQYYPQQHQYYLQPQQFQPQQQQYYAELQQFCTIDENGAIHVGRGVKKVVSDSEPQSSSPSRESRFFFPLYQMMSLPPFRDNEVINTVEAFMGIPPPGTSEDEDHGDEVDHEDPDLAQSPADMGMDGDGMQVA